MAKGQLTPELIRKLESVDSPTISNAIERFKVRSRREGYMGPQIVCRFPHMGRIVGYATTCTIVEYDENFPPDPRERFKWLESIHKSPKPAICVVKDTCHRKGWSSHWGEIVGTQVQVLGARAIITDGAVRDLEALEAMGMKTWSEYVVVSHGWIDVGKADIPVEVGGLVVNPGDILHADMNGVVSIPAEVLDDMPAAIDDVLKKEQTFIKSMRDNGYDIEAHRRQVEH
ncbi:MAG TPA: RraA family protein [Candidatus Latescibacteria bacterium]|nr:RraA family protein [Candidatus Latescibacterota bacterium]